MQQTHQYENIWLAWSLERSNSTERRCSVSWQGFYPFPSCTTIWSPLIYYCQSLKALSLRVRSRLNDHLEWNLVLKFIIYQRQNMALGLANQRLQISRFLVGFGFCFNWTNPAPKDPAQGAGECPCNEIC